MNILHAHAIETVEIVQTKPGHEYWPHVPTPFVIHADLAGKGRTARRRVYVRPNGELYVTYYDHELTLQFAHKAVVYTKRTNRG